MPLAEPSRGFDRQDLLPNRLADFLRDEIVAGRLAPGERLIEQSLAEECGVSRVPLREAFRILGAEGWITLSPHRGATVSPLSDDELIELFGARAAIEGYAARLAASVEPRPDLRPLRAIVTAMRSAVAAGEFSRYYELAGRFHDGLVALSANNVLQRLFWQIRGQLRRYQAAMSRVPELPDRSIREHVRILKAIERGDAEAAQIAAEAHIGGLVEQFRRRPAQSKGGKQQHAQ